MDIAKDIINGSLTIPDSSEDNYRNLLFDAKPVNPEYDILTQLDFDYPQVSNKVKYAKRIIDNHFTSDLNELIRNYSTATTSERVLFRIRNIKRGLKSSLVKLQSAIDEHFYDLDKLKDRKARYSTDLAYYENAYILHYAQQAHIRYAVEFQAHFIDLIPEEKRITPALIYNEFLRMAIPDTLPVNVDYSIEIAPKAPLNLDIEVEKMTNLAQIFVNTTKPYGFLELKSITDLPTGQIGPFITYMTSKDVPYVVAMLDFLGYPKHLRANFNMTKENIFKHLKVALNGKSVRMIKGNLNILRPDSKEDASRYTSPQYINEVREDYDKFRSATI